MGCHAFADAGRLRCLLNPFGDCTGTDMEAVEGEIIWFPAMAIQLTRGKDILPLPFSFGIWVFSAE